MSNINPDTVCFIIAKAKQFHAKEEVVISQVPLSSSDDWARQGLAGCVHGVCEQELNSRA